MIKIQKPRDQSSSKFREMLEMLKVKLKAGAVFVGRRCAEISGVWSQIKDLRIIAIVLAATSALLILVDPGKDVLRDLTDVANSSVAGFWFQPVAWRWATLIVFCIIAGLNAWYWSHLLYKSDLRRTSERGVEPRWFTHTRRGLGLLPLASVVIALPISVNWRWWEIYKGMILCAVFTGLLLAFFMTRETIARIIDRRFGDNLSRPSVFPGAHLARGDVLFMYVTTISSCVIFILLLIPDVRTWLAWSLGPAAITFMAVSSIIPLTSVLIWSTRAQGVPVIALGLAAFVVFSFCNDNHDVRALPGEATRPLDVEKALIKCVKSRSTATPYRIQ